MTTKVWQSKTGMHLEVGSVDGHMQVPVIFTALCLPVSYIAGRIGLTNSFQLCNGYRLFIKFESAPISSKCPTGSKVLSIVRSEF